MENRANHPTSRNDFLSFYQHNAQVMNNPKINENLRKSEVRFFELKTIS